MKIKSFKDAFVQVPVNLEQQNSKIMDSASMNFTRWDVNQNQHNASKVTSESTLGTGKYAYKQIVTKTRDDYLTNLKSYVTNRLSFLSDNLTVAAPAGSIAGTISYAAGDELSLTADCTADSYQWQSSSDGIDWTNIDGATEKTYSDTATSNSQIGAFMIRVTDGNGTVHNFTYDGTNVTKS